MRLLLFFLSITAFADPNCPDRPFNLKGGAVAQVRAFDQFILKHRSAADFAARLAKDGLPFSLDVKKGGVKGVKDWVSSEGMSGDAEASVFLHKLAVAAGSGLRFDQAFLLEAPGAKKAKYKWNVPFNTFYPAAIDGDELIFSHQLHPFCKDGDSQDVMLAVKPDGSLRVRTDVKAENYKMIEKCPGKKVFPKSDYAACSELTDLKTKKKVVLVWEQPMT